MTDNTTPRPRLLVIGAGFAGLNLVKKLDVNKYRVTVVDSNNYHSFPPLFYQLASAGLDAASINFPLRRELRKRGVKQLKVVFSEELPVRPCSGQPTAGEAPGACVPAEPEEGQRRRDTPGSTSFVPPVAGLIIASELVKDLIA